MLCFSLLQSEQKIKKTVAARGQKWQQRLTHYTGMIQELTDNPENTAGRAVRDHGQANLDRKKGD